MAVPVPNTSTRSAFVMSGGVNHNELSASTATNAIAYSLRRMGIRERLVEVMDAVGSDAQLARLARVSKTSVSEWRSGRIKALKAETAVNIQEATGYSVRWLVTGQGPKKIGDKSSSGALAHRTLSPSDDKKLLVVLSGFLDTDQEGRNEIVEAVKSIVGENEPSVGQRDKQQPVVPKKRGGSANR